MKLGERIVDGVFLERPNRYLARVLVEGEERTAHVPDPGRLPGLMIPNRAVRLIYRPGPKRKTDYTLALVRHGSIWVSVYPVFANALVGKALSESKLPGFSGYASFAAEARMGSSRFDFRLEFSKGPCFVEVKSVSFVEAGRGKFPDAPTARGVRHVQELIELKEKGCRTAVIFVSQRSDTRSIEPCDEIDPQFGESLRKAKAAGVELYGFNCRVTRNAVSLKDSVDIILP